MSTYIQIYICHSSNHASKYSECDKFVKTFPAI